MSLGTMAGVLSSVRGSDLVCNLGSCFTAPCSGRSCSSSFGREGFPLEGTCNFDCVNFNSGARRKPGRCFVAVEASSSSGSSGSNVSGASNGRAEKTSIVVGSKSGARERRLNKAQEEKRRKEGQGRAQYPEWATILEDACKDDVELREIIGDSFGNPEEMRKRVEERVRRKGRDILSPVTGSAIPMTVTFKADFDATDAHVWLELFGSPSDKDLETIGSVLRSWYLLGRLGAFNSMNMQLTQLPIDARLSYSNDRAAEALPSAFHNIGDLEFQDNWGRFWVDFGTSDPVAMDVLINAFSAVSSDHVGIKQLVFGGQKLGDWAEGMVDPEDGYRCYKI
ncbi:hypothetical protein MPTK1_8g04100 [Marchantia polymorpha subsp. ruderalis]|uniref:DUF3531 domain-containing protein n=1 Tax=Marchantia polymorpha TaxID=3197 RepID=A0A2R6XJI6_MARPO|nr:hypothetical protein MARPO_0012s0199 [Marchantia polymorpha]BBN18631.1 hypothetical protein Mp_8g04100 [Marchantia polymorpha subsp. ruderalis]|eukprot:PTQ46278.1 hypothetical protein MARPO_0012s0199 [Marchantia polymorpha]